MAGEWPQRGEGRRYIVHSNELLIAFVDGRDIAVI